MLAFQPERVRLITCPAFRAENPSLSWPARVAERHANASNFQRRTQAGPARLDRGEPCPIIIIGPRASCALRIMSAQDARGPMRMTWRTLSSVRGASSKPDHSHQNEQGQRL